jgi:hypothetical protein
MKLKLLVLATALATARASSNPALAAMTAALRDIGMVRQSSISTAHRRRPSG